MAYNTLLATSGTLTPGTSPNAVGFSFVTIAAPGIQNGDPDGFALVNNGVVIQFLSYEGTFTAVGGDADGLVSVDIGVAEGGGTPIGNSIQLQGTGNAFGDFTFVAGTRIDFCAVNNGQTFTPVPEPTTILGLSAAGLGAFRLVRRRVIG